MTEYSYSRFIYLDTNIVSSFCKNESLWPLLFDFLKDNDLTVGIGAGQVAELSDAQRLHVDLARFLTSVPTGIIKNWDEIITEEVQSHPKHRTNSLLMYPLNAILLEKNGFEKLVQFLSSKALSEARHKQLHHAKQMAGQHSILKNNFPPKSSGSYTRKQADEFSDAQVLQWLAQTQIEFLKQVQGNIEEFNPYVFLSIRIFGYVIFYKYYLGRREPKKLSDFGDLFHLFALPYCEIAIMERDLCETLNQIKKNHSVLELTDIYSIDFLKKLEPRIGK